MRRLAESLDQAGVRIVNVEGQRYEAGMAVTALNVADFGVDDPLWVDQMLEPILMGPEGIISVGTVTVRNSAV